MPHAHEHVLARFHMAGPAEVERAIDAAARRSTMGAPPQTARARCSFGPRSSWPGSTAPRSTRRRCSARARPRTRPRSTPPASSSTSSGSTSTSRAHPRRAAGELAGHLERARHRPLEGFVFAVSPFNFTSIAGNLPTAPALMGNTVVWKPASTAAYSAHFLMQLFEEAGLPPGVINLVYGSGAQVGDPVLAQPDLAGVHFTGSTAVFHGMWKTVAGTSTRYRTYPRLVGETGGKDFIFAHESADVDALAVAIVRGAFEFQGQKCSAASRVFAEHPGRRRARPGRRMMRRDQAWATCATSRTSWAPSSTATPSRITWRSSTRKDVEELRPGRRHLRRQGRLLRPAHARRDAGPDFRSCARRSSARCSRHRLRREGTTTPSTCRRDAPYALTGAVFARDRAASSRRRAPAPRRGQLLRQRQADGRGRGAAALRRRARVGDQRQGRLAWNLVRWVSPRTIKETFVPPTDYRYPFMSRTTSGCHSGGAGRPVVHLRARVRALPCDREARAVGRQRRRHGRPKRPAGCRSTSRRCRRSSRVAVRRGRRAAERDRPEIGERQRPARPAAALDGASAIHSADEMSS